MAQRRDSFYFGGKPRTLSLDKKTEDGSAALPALVASTNLSSQITPPKTPSKKKSFATLRKLSVFVSRKQKSVRNESEIILSDGRIDEAIPTTKTATVNNTTISAINASSAIMPQLIDSTTYNKVFPEAPGRSVKRRVPPSSSSRRGSIFDNFVPSTSAVSVSNNTVARSSSIKASTVAITPSSGILMVPRKGPPSPASSIKETTSLSESGAKISELSDDEDTIEVPTRMPPSPPVSATYSYTSFSEILPKASQLKRQASTESRLSDSEEEEETEMKDEGPGSTMVAVEQSSRPRLSSVMRGKRPSQVQAADSVVHELAVQRIPRLVESRPQQRPPTFSKQKNKAEASGKGKGVEMKPFSFGTNSNPGTSTQLRNTSRPAYGVEAGLRQMANDERLLAEELRRMEQEDRKLAEELQRIEDEEGRLAISKEEEEEWKQVLLIENEEITRYYEEVDRLIHEDELLARALMAQEEAEMEEGRRERERVLREEREREEAAKQRWLDSIRNIGATVGIRRVEKFGRLSNVEHDQLTEDAIARLRQVTMIFTMSLPALPIIKVEWIINEKLRKEFEDCKEQLRKAGRSTDEVLLWHGTQAKNVIPIITHGFRVGGVNGHPVAHGSSMGLGIYSSTEANMPVNSYNTANRTVIAFRALPGTISFQALYAVPGQIAVDWYDSHCSGTVYVIRRPCQTLPCFLVHY